MSIAALKADKPFGTAGSFEPGEKHEKDAENLGSPLRKYSRIGPAVSGATADSDSDNINIERQIELEADAAIKYRTCSWQKVRFFVSFGTQNINTSTMEVAYPGWYSTLFRLQRWCEYVRCTNQLCRLLLFFSQNTSAWRLCPSHIHIRFSALFLGSF